MKIEQEAWSLEIMKMYDHPLTKAIVDFEREFKDIYYKYIEKANRMKLDKYEMNKRELDEYNMWSNICDNLFRDTADNLLMSIINAKIEKKTEEINKLKDDLKRLEEDINERNKQINK